MIKKDGKKKISADLSETYRQLGPYLGLGTQIAASLTVLTLLGYYIDLHYTTKPIFTLIGAFLGAITGLYSFFKTLKSLENNKRKK